MNKRFQLLFLMMISFSIRGQSQAPGWQWANRIGGDDWDAGNGIAVDAVGNCYVTGSFSGDTVTFGNIVLQNSNPGSSFSDIFIAKYDAAGNIIWATSAGGIKSDAAYAIALDNNGNLGITGVFLSPSIAFSSTVLTNADSLGSSVDIFIAKYDTSGNVLWAKSALGSGSEYSKSVAVDSSGNFFITGFFQCPLIVFDNDTLFNTDTVGFTSSDIFVVKYDWQGNLLWAIREGGTDFENSFSIAADANGNVYITGSYNDSAITFGSTTLINDHPNSTTDVFLVKYDDAGNVLWARKAGGANDDEGYGVTVDVTGNAYITGYFESNNIHFGFNSFNNSGSADIFIAKYSASGNFLWAACAGGVSYDQGYDIAVDAAGNSYITGMFDSYIITFGGTTLTNAAGFDIFIVKCDSSGNLLWAQGAGGYGNDTSPGIAIDASANSYITGMYFSSTIAFGTITLTNSTNFPTDGYVAKAGNATGITEANNFFNPNIIFPNPVTDELFIASNTNEVSEIIIYDIASGKLLQRKFINSVSLSTKQLAKGIYLYELRNKNGVVKKGKFVKD